MSPDRHDRVDSCAEGYEHVVSRPDLSTVINAVHRTPEKDKLYDGRESYDFTKSHVSDLTQEKADGTAKSCMRTTHSEGNSLNIIRIASENSLSLGSGLHTSLQIRDGGRVKAQILPSDEDVRSLEATPSISSTSSLIKTGYNTFRHFPRLPVELRMQIWKHVLVQRTIGFDLFSQLFATPYTPPMLHACSESRHLALKTYVPIRRCAFDDRNLIFFSKALDQLLCYTHGNDGLDPRAYAEAGPLHMGTGAPLSLEFLPPIFFKIRTLAIDIDTWEDLPNKALFSSHIWDMLRENENLEEIVLIWSHDDLALPLEQSRHSRMHRKVQRELILDVVCDEGSQYNLDYFAWLDDKVWRWKSMLKQTAIETKGWNEPRLTYGHVEWKELKSSRLTVRKHWDIFEEMVPLDLKNVCDYPL